MTQRRRKIMKTLPFFSLLFITYAIVDIGEADQVRCPRYCLCYFDPKTDMRAVSCVARRLGNIDLSIPKRVQSLDLSNNSISLLEDRAFQNYGLIELVNLVIKHNLIQTIGLHSFAGLSYLQRLDLTDNSLYQILPWTFHDNSNLRFISLSDNPLGHVSHSGPFLDVPSLEVLLLSKCNFAHFAEDAFSALPNLKILDISHNQLITFAVYPLQFLHHLEELDISSNPWQCNTNLETLKNFLESRSSNLIGSSCDFQKDITTQQSKFEKIISVGVYYPEYNDESGSDESFESDESFKDTEEVTEKQRNREINCSLGGNGTYQYIFLSPTILSLISFQLGVCSTLFIRYFYTYCKKNEQVYQPLDPLLTMPSHTEIESAVVIQPEEQDQPIQILTETIVCPETPPPSYRELFMS